MSKGKKRLIILFSLIFIALAVMTYQHAGRPSALHRFLSYPYDLLNKFTSSVNTTFFEVWDTFYENRRLKKELARGLLERQRYAEIIQENKRLKEVLLLKAHLPNYVTTARIIARGYDSLLNTAILDKGESSGIKKDMAVITTKGLFGKIYSVKADFSEVLLLRDTNFSVAVRLQNSRREGVLSGSGSSYGLLKYIPPEETVARGEMLVTSGLDGLFPQGLPVGVVNKVKKEGVEFFQYIEVMPFQSDSTAEEVVILAHSS